MDRSIELRINSLQDAKSVVYNMAKITQTIEAIGLDSVEFLIAQEIKDEVSPILAGVFRIKTYTSYVKPRGDNVVFLLPHYQEKQRIPVSNGNGNGNHAIDGVRSLETKISEPVLNAPESTPPVTTEVPIATRPSPVMPVPKRRGMPKGGWPKKNIQTST